MMLFSCPPATQQPKHLENPQDVTMKTTQAGLPATKQPVPSSWKPLLWFCLVCRITWINTTVRLFSQCLEQMLQISTESRAFVCSRSQAEGLNWQKPPCYRLSFLLWILSPLQREQKQGWFHPCKPMRGLHHQASYTTSDKQFSVGTLLTYLGHCPCQTSRKSSGFHSSFTVNLMFGLSPILAQLMLAPIRTVFKLMS